MIQVPGIQYHILYVSQIAFFPYFLTWFGVCLCLAGERAVEWHAGPQLGLGLHFFHIFSHGLVCVFVWQVSVLLNGMLDHSFRERVVRKNHGSRLVELVLQRWDCLHPWWGTSASTPESKTATLVLLSKLLQVQIQIGRASCRERV